MAKENEYISSAAETMFEFSQDNSIRFFLEGVEEANRIRRGQEIRLERAETALREAKEELQAKDNALQAKDDALQAKEDELKSLTEEIARLKALLAKK